MIEGKTQSGFAFKVDKTKLRDARVVRMLANAETNPLLWPEVSAKVLGEEQFDKLCDFIEKEVGYPDTEKLVEMFGEIINIVSNNDEEVKK
jgi:hypothetical protein